MNLEIFTKIDNIVKYYEQRINDYEKLSLRIKRILELKTDRQAINRWTNNLKK